MHLSYLLSLPLYRITLFFRRWYREASRSYWAWVVDFFRKLDRTFALKINTRYWLQPLYGDYTTVGKLIGPVFRTGRIVGTLGFYGLLFSFFFILWLCWVLAIPYFIFKILRG